MTVRPLLFVSFACAAVVAACADDVAPREDAPWFEAYAGDWAGGWHNTTLDATGDTTMSVSVDGSTIVLDVSGLVFGGDPDAEDFTGTFDESQASLTGESAFFGEFAFDVGITSMCAVPSRRLV